MERALQSDLKQVFEAHPKLFRDSTDRDYNVLVAFLVHERLKNTGSFWYPYFEACDPGIRTVQWPSDILR